MTFKRAILAAMCLSAILGGASASAQRYPQRVTGSDGTRYLRLGPNFYGNDTGQSAPGLGANGSGLDAYRRPIYRGVTGGNTTDTTGRQNPTAQGSYGASRAQADATRSDATRQAELDRFLHERAQIQARREAYFRTLQR